MLHCMSAAKLKKHKTGLQIQSKANIFSYKTLKWFSSSLWSNLKPLICFFLCVPLFSPQHLSHPFYPHSSSNCVWSFFLSFGWETKTQTAHLPLSICSISPASPLSHPSAMKHSEDSLSLYTLLHRRASSFSFSIFPAVSSVFPFPLTSLPHFNPKTPPRFLLFFLPSSFVVSLNLLVYPCRGDSFCESLRPRCVYVRVCLSVYVYICVYVVLHCTDPPQAHTHTLAAQSHTRHTT